MAITYSLGPNPKWYFVDNNGQPLAGGLFYTYSSLNPSILQPVYADPNGVFPLPDPQVIDANGTLGPFWFQFDSSNPDNGYLIIVTDSIGQIIWTVDNYFASTGGSGPGPITEIITITNLINNNVMYRHAGPISPVPAFSVIAPSNNTGLVGNGTVNNGCPDIVFIKNNATSTDSISFPQFTLGTEPIVGDTAPVDYFNYTNSVAGSETDVFLQFPVTAKVQNLSGQTVSGSFWGQSISGNDLVTLNWMQFFGDGAGASSPAISPVFATFNLTTSWAKYPFTGVVIPSVSGMTLGAPNNQGPNDGLFLQVNFPAASLCNINFTKLVLVLGNNPPSIDFTGYDNIDSVISLPRTGDYRTSLNSFYPFGWVPCNDGVISNGGSITAPTGIPVSRNNVDTYPLYSLIWTLTSGYPSFAPIYNSAGTLTTRGASAIADFSAGNQLSLTKQLGRVIAGANPTLIASQTFTASTLTNQITVSNAAQFPTGTPVLISNSGGALPTFSPLDNVPAIYYTIFINATTLQLARSVDLAQVPTPLTIATAGSGTQTIQNALGTNYGSGAQLIGTNFLPAHTHFAASGQFFIETGTGGNNYGTGGFTTSNQSTTGFNTTSAIALNIVQPTTFMNVFLKL